MLRSKIHSCILRCYLVFCNKSMVSSFKIISVTGAHSGVGKTTLCSVLLNNLKGFGAIKFTKTLMYTSLNDEDAILMQKNKDTAILSESGAERVVWIQSPVSGLEKALNIAVGKMEDLPGVVIEGNSPVDFIAPHLILFVIGQNGEIKPSASKLVKKADIIIFNSEADEAFPPILDSIQHDNKKIFRINLANKTGEIDKFTTYVKKYIV